MGGTEPIVATVRADVVTLINSYPAVGSQEELEWVKKEAEDFTLNVARHFPGFISANLFETENSVINVVQWESKEAFQAFRSDPKVTEGIAKIEARIQPTVRVCRLYKVIPAARNT